MTPNEVFFGLITAAIIALIIVVIWLCLKLGQTVQATKAFLETAQQSIQESLGEVNQNLKTLRTLTDNINAAADDVTSFTGSIGDVGDEVKQIASDVRQIGDIRSGLERGNPCFRIRRARGSQNRFRGITS